MKENVFYLIDDIRLMNEWDFDLNKDLDPNILTLSSKRKAWWICSKCKNKWNTQIYLRQKHGCPYCNGKYAIKGKNDLKTLYPNVALEWNYDRNSKEGYDIDKIALGSQKLVWWICPKRT